MSRVAIIFLLIAIILASPARAELRTLPGGTTEIAVTRIGCSVVIDGHELINGTCHYRLTMSGEVLMTLPEATTQISVNKDRRMIGAGWSLWMQAPDGKVCRGPLGGLASESGCKRSATNEYLMDCGNCWSNERVRICYWPLQANSPPSAGAPSEICTT